MASGEKRARPCEGFYRTVEDGVCFKSERIPRECTAKVDKEMYEIEIVDRDKANNRMKIHYVGYPDDNDEWRGCGELMGNDNLGRVRPRFSPSMASLEDRGSLLFDSVSRQIKHALFATKRESPEVRVEEKIQRDVYDTYLKDIGLIRNRRGRQIHCVNSVSDPDLCRLFGEKWYERILNKNGDFSYVARGTIQFWIHEKAPIKEYVTVGNQLFLNEIKNDLLFIFTFVRRDGVKNEYSTNLWK